MNGLGRSETNQQKDEHRNHGIGSDDGTRAPSATRAVNKFVHAKNEETEPSREEKNWREGLLVKSKQHSFGIFIVSETRARGGGAGRASERSRKENMRRNLILPYFFLQPPPPHFRTLRRARTIRKP